MSASTGGSFVERIVNVTVKLGRGNYGISGIDTVTLLGYRTFVHVERSGSGGFGGAEVRILNVPFDVMNKVNTLGLQFMPGVRRNQLQIDAGDTVNGTETVFLGTIVSAWIDFDAAPNVALVINAMVGMVANMQPAPPISYAGSANVAVMLANIAQQLNVPFENNGVSVVLSNPYFSGTPRQQIDAICRAANVDWSFDTDAGPLAISPKGGSRTKSIPLISPESGMVGYPTYTPAGILVRTIYSPALSVPVFGLIQVQSNLPQANGQWSPYRIVLDLESQAPGGQWFMSLSCVAKKNQGSPVL